MAHEAAMVGRILGLPVVFTDHSLAGLKGVVSLNVNRILQVIVYYILQY